MEFEIRTNLYKREKYLKKIRGFYHECEIIKVLTGVRRCGKSSIMILLCNNTKIKIHSAYFSEMQKPDFVFEMIKQEN